MSFLGLGKKKEVSTESDRKPRVLIAVAGFHGVVPEAQENFFQFAYRCGRNYPEYDFLLKIIIKREQFRARNNLVDLAIINECEYILMLDDDMIVPEDLFGRLKAHDKEIVGALYYQRGGAYHPVLMKQKNLKHGLKGIDFINHFDPCILKPGLHKMDVIGGGCMLIKVDSFRKIPQPYFWIDGITGTDVHLCNQFKEAGVQPYVDTSIELGHVGDPEIVNSRTLPNYTRALGEVNEQLWEDLKDHFLLDNTQLESEIIKSAAGDSRAKEWNSKPRNDWEDIREFYVNGGDWAVFNLAAYNLKFDQAREWAINNIDRVMKKPGVIADIGCGIGYVDIALAERNNQNIIAMDLAKTKTMDFLKWRIQKHKLQDKIQTIEFDTPVPSDLENPVDGALMISVFDHLYDPKGMIDWITRNVKPGGFLLCDSWRNIKQEDEPQHIIKLDPNEALRLFHKKGWKSVPENPFLFIKEK